MHTSCSNSMPALPRNTECGAPIGHTTTISGTYYPTAGELAFLEQIRTDAFAAELAQVDALLADRPEPHQPMRLVVAGRSMAERITCHLAELEVIDVEVQPAPPLPSSQRGNYQWTPAMAEAKAAAWDTQQPRHGSSYTHTTPPTTKARKAARRRARAGRKASR